MLKKIFAASEVWGITIGVLGLLSALGIYANFSGMIEHFISLNAYALLGKSAWVLPPALLFFSFNLLKQDQQRPPMKQIGFGILIVVISIAMLLGIGASWGTNPISSNLYNFGGWLGKNLDVPLIGVLGYIGAVLVACGLLVIGIKYVLVTSVAQMSNFFWSRFSNYVLTSAKTLEDKKEKNPKQDSNPDSRTRFFPSPGPLGNPIIEIEDKGNPTNNAIEISSPRIQDSNDLPIRSLEEDPVVPDSDHFDVSEVKDHKWKLPSISLLKTSASIKTDKAAVERRGKLLEEALLAHGVQTNLVGMTVGPTVTRYELELGSGVKVARVTSLTKDIAYAMASPDVRILAPIPGRSAIGVEVPNEHRQLVTLADILVSSEARKAHHPLEVALGRDIAGRAVMGNLAEMPHILIAGATGAGKSSCINSIITSILMRATPEQVRLILIDPKRVELGQYNGLPHLLTQVVVNPKKAANALSWAVAEMERRYDLLAEAGHRDITGYNAAFDEGTLFPLNVKLEQDSQEKPPTKLPFILVIVDELNDLMMVAARNVEESICRLAQMARAVGIHLVIATQRPSVDVITGVIKANVPSRLAFSVSSLADSRVILDQPGAERLVGKGDLLLLTASSNIPRRLQAPWVQEEEIRSVVANWKAQGHIDYIQGVAGEVSGIEGKDGPDDEEDELYSQALELVVRNQIGSTSMLQRKLRVGFARAGRLMDILERHGVVGPSEGSKARSVLMTPEELDEMRSSSGQMF